MNLNTLLLALLVLLIAWEFVLRIPALKLARRLRERRMQVPVPTSQVPVFSMQLLLCDPKGKTEHEITFHGTDAPERYSYAGKTYTQEKRHHSTQPLDIIWEYRR